MVKYKITNSLFDAPTGIRGDNRADICVVESIAILKFAQIFLKMPHKQMPHPFVHHNNSRG